jgi:hypothetical protein
MPVPDLPFASCASRRIATRYDKHADIYLSVILLAAAITWWID